MTGGPHLLLHSDACSWGGAETAAVHVLEAVGGVIDRVTVVGCNDAVVQQLVSASAVPADGVLVPARASTVDPRPLGPTRRAIQRARPDVVHINAAFTWGNPYALVALQRVAVPAVALHEHLPLDGRIRPLVALKRRVARRAAAIVTGSGRAARETDALLRLAPGTARVIPYGVAGPDGTAVRRVTDAPTLVTVGRVTDQKGFDVLLDAAAGLPGVHVVVVGEGPRRAALLEQTERLGIAGRVHLPGWVDDARAWLRGADVVVIPSRWESGPLTLLEALAEARPVVTTDVGIASEVVTPGVTGELVAVDDVDGLRSAVRGLLDDRARAARLAAGGHDVWARRHRLDQHRQQWADLYRDLIGRLAT